MLLSTAGFELMARRLRTPQATPIHQWRCSESSAPLLPAERWHPRPCRSWDAQGWEGGTVLPCTWPTPAGTPMGCRERGLRPKPKASRPPSGRSQPSAPLLSLLLFFCTSRAALLSISSPCLLPQSPCSPILLTCSHTIHVVRLAHGQGNTTAA